MRRVSKTQNKNILKQKAEIITIKHPSGKTSNLVLKYYTKAGLVFKGTDKPLIWWDVEEDIDE